MFSLYTSLPQDIQNLIFSSYLEPVDLVNMEISGKYFKEHPGIREAWKRFETKLSYQVNQNINPLKNYKCFINDCEWTITSSSQKNRPQNIQHTLNLKTPPSFDQTSLLTRYSQFLTLKLTIQRYPAKQIPPDVAELLEIKTVATQKQISQLKFFSRARDILCFWQAMARAIRIDVDFDFSSCEQVIQQSKEFPHWVEEHRDQLNQITSLSLKKCWLTSCPKEIGMLQSLTHLNLYENFLLSIPKEIGMLQNLTYLNLSINSLTLIPKDIGKLQKLDYCNLSWNKLVSLPKALLTLPHLQHLNLDGNYSPLSSVVWR